MALARALECKPNSRDILVHLREHPATIIVDDIDQMLDLRNIEHFEVFFEIINQSPHQSHWILSMTKSNLDVIDKTFKARRLFGKIIDLHEVDLDECRDILLGRQRLSGLAIDYPHTFLSDLALKFGLSSNDEMFFRVLHEKSHGHIRHMIFLWLLSLKSCDGKSIDLSLEKVTDRGLPMIQEFSFPQKMILSQLYHFHFRSGRRLSRKLGVPQSIIDNELQYLEYCGLVQSRSVDRTTYEIPKHLVMPVGQELKKGGFVDESTHNI